MHVVDWDLVCGNLGISTDLSRERCDFELVWPLKVSLRT
jgi:hypothetical protein